MPDHARPVGERPSLYFRFRCWLDKLLHGSVVSKKPIPPEDLERASRYVRERGWVKDDTDV